MHGTVLGGSCKVGDLTSISLCCVVLNNVNIGSNAIVGSGSIVTRNIPDNVIAYGQPAKVRRSRVVGEKYLYTKREEKYL